MTIEEQKIVIAFCIGLAVIALIRDIAAEVLNDD